MGCKACTRHLQGVQDTCQTAIRQFKGVQYSYQKGWKACTRHLQAVQGMYKTATRGVRHLPKGVQGMYKVAKWGARHVQDI